MYVTDDWIFYIEMYISDARALSGGCLMCYIESISFVLDGRGEGYTLLYML